MSTESSRAEQLDIAGLGIQTYLSSLELLQCWLEQHQRSIEAVQGAPLIHLAPWQDSPLDSRC